MQNLVVVSHTVCVHVEVPKFWGILGPTPFGQVHRNTILPNMCYRTNFHRSWSNCLGVVRGSQENWIGDTGALPLGTGDACLLHRITLLPHVILYQISSLHVKPFGHYYWKQIRTKILNPASRLLRSLKVTGTDKAWSATYDFLLVFHSNYEPILYHFRE